TGTHGSGSTSLAAAVHAIEFLGADGAVRRVRAGERDFAGSVVSLGALGVVLRVQLAIEPAYLVAQQVWDRVRYDTVTPDVASVLSAGDSVSLFTDWSGEHFQQVWVKNR